MQDHVHGHSHGAIDPVLLSTQQRIAAIKWSTAALLITALVQFAVALISGSVAFLVDTVIMWETPPRGCPCGWPLSSPGNAPP